MTPIMEIPRRASRGSFLPDSLVSRSGGGARSALKPGKRSKTPKRISPMISALGKEKFVKNIPFFWIEMNIGFARRNLNTPKKQYPLKTLTDNL